MTTASRSAQARALRAAHPDLSLSEVAARVGLTRQGVERALARASKCGRPPAGTVQLHLRLPPEVADYLRAEAQQSGDTLGDVVSSIVELWMCLD